MNRARRLLDGAPEGPAHGYLAYLDAAVAVMNRPATHARVDPSMERWCAQFAVCRRRGDFEGAFAAYTRARTLGIEPQPGEALLRCRTGDSDTAWTDLRVALAGLDRLDRMWLLRGAVEAETGARAAWRQRLVGLRANASTKSHAELDESTELDEGDPEDLGRRHAELRVVLPAVAVLGGCCGTDARHVAAVCSAWRGD